MPSRRTSLANDVALPASLEEARSPQTVEPRDGDVEGDALRQEAALGLAILRQQHDPGGDRLARTGWATGLAVQAIAPARARVGADQRAQQLGAAGTGQAADAEDLAGADVEIDVVEHARRRQPADARATSLAGRRSRCG